MAIAVGKRLDQFTHLQSILYLDILVELFGDRGEEAIVASFDLHFPLSSSNLGGILCLLHLLQVLCSSLLQIVHDIL